MITLKDFDGIEIDNLNILAVKKDGSRVPLCICNNVEIAETVKSALEVAIMNSRLPCLKSYLTASNSFITPAILASGNVGLVVTLLEDEIFQDGENVSPPSDVELGTAAYTEFVQGLYPSGVVLPGLVTAPLTAPDCTSAVTSVQMFKIVNPDNAETLRCPGCGWKSSTLYVLAQNVEAAKESEDALCEDCFCGDVCDAETVIIKQS